MDEDSLRKLLGLIAGGTLGAKGGKVRGLSGGIVGAIGGLFAADLVNAATRQSTGDALANLEDIDVSLEDLLKALTFGAAMGFGGAFAVLAGSGIDLEAALPDFKDRAEALTVFAANRQQAQRAFEDGFRMTIDKMAARLKAEGIPLHIDQSEVDQTVRDVRQYYETLAP